MMNDLDDLVASASQAFAAAPTPAELENAKARFLGKAGRVTELMKQKQYAPMSVADMAVSLYAVNEGYMDDLPMGKIQAFEKALHQHFHSSYGDMMAKMAVSGDWNNDIEATFKKGIAEFKKTGSW